MLTVQFDLPRKSRRDMKFRIEHFALNVADPAGMASWYEKYIGMKIVRKIEAAHNTHFLLDCSGSIMIEIYNNPPGEVPGYPAMNPLQLHVALVSDDPEGDKRTLMNAGATYVEEVHLPDGSHLIMLRDPWGLALQLCKRGNPMLENT